jgi:thioredoxin
MAFACLAAPVAASRTRVAPPSTRGSARPTPAPRIDVSRRNSRDSVSGAFGTRRRGETTPCRATKQSYASFDDMIAKSPVPVLVDFYATWCGPCQLLSKQVFPQVAAAVGRDKVSLVKIDTEKYPNIASKFKVEALPTIILFKNGQVADRIEGLPDAAQLTERLKYMLGAS